MLKFRGFKSQILLNNYIKNIILNSSKCIDNNNPIKLVTTHHFTL